SFVSRLLASRIVAGPVPPQACATDWVAGASMIIRSAVFDSAGLMDEKYFMYFEEVDFCLQAKRAGWPCWYVPASRVVHLVGAASGVTDVKKPARRRPRYWFESPSRSFRRNPGRLYQTLSHLAWACGYALVRARRRLR